MIDGQKLYIELSRMPVEKRKATVYEVVADRDVLKNLAETSIEDDIVRDWDEDGKITMDDVHEAFLKMTPDEVSKVIVESRRAIMDCNADKELWRIFNETLAAHLRTTLTEKMRKLKGVAK